MDCDQRFQIVYYVVVIGSMLWIWEVTYKTMQKINGSQHASPYLSKYKLVKN